LRSSVKITNASSGICDLQPPFDAQNETIQPSRRARHWPVARNWPITCQRGPRVSRSRWAWS